MDTTAASPAAAELRDMVAGKGYQVVPVDIGWKRRTVSRYAKEFIDFYQQNKANGYNLVLGNSLGAMVGLVSAPIVRPDSLVLCSLSGFFKIDVAKPEVQRYKERFGTTRWGDFATLDADSLAYSLAAIPTKVTMTYGELEKEWYPTLVERVEQTARILQIEPIELVGAPHSMTEPMYIQRLGEVL